MILDANTLLCAGDEASPHHQTCSTWLTEALDGPERVGLPWQTPGAFKRIATHPRVSARPLSAAGAQDFVDAWLDAPSTWVPPATERTARAYADLARRHHVVGILVTDAQLAALALDLGVAVVSAERLRPFPRGAVGQSTDCLRRIRASRLRARGRA